MIFLTNIPNTIEGEFWLPISGYENYAISNCGRIYSFARNNYRKLSMGAHGYYQVNLCSNGILKLHSVARLVAKTFLDNPFNKPHVNHIDAVRTNNHVSNLEWCTQAENNQHSWNMEKALGKVRKRRARPKLVDSTTGNESEIICLMDHLQAKEIASIFGVTKNRINCLLSVIRKSDFNVSEHQYRICFANKSGTSNEIFTENIYTFSRCVTKMFHSRTPTEVFRDGQKMIGFYLQQSA